MLNHYVASLRLFARLCAGGNNYAVRSFVRPQPLLRCVVASSRCAVAAAAGRRCVRSRIYGAGLALLCRGRRVAAACRSCGVMAGGALLHPGTALHALHETALHGAARNMCCAALRGCAVYSVMRVCACAGRVCCSRDILCAPGDGAALTRTGARDLVRGLAVARLLLPRPAQGTCPTRRHREACWRAGACRGCRSMSPGTTWGSGALPP